MTSRTDLVDRALARLTPELAARALADVAAFLDQHAAALAATRRGVRVAPHWRRPLAELLAAEGTRRARLDDLSWIVWDSYAAVERRSSRSA